jgi:hypothetical protein
MARTHAFTFKTEVELPGSSSNMLLALIADGRSLGSIRTESVIGRVKMAPWER